MPRTGRQLSHERMRASRQALLLVVALLAGGLANGCGGSDYPETPEALVREFERAWNDVAGDGEAEPVCALLTEEARATAARTMATGPEGPATRGGDCAYEIERFWRTQQAGIGYPAIYPGDVVDTDETDGRATVKTDGGFTFKLVKQDGVWKFSVFPLAPPSK